MGQFAMIILCRYENCDPPYFCAATETAADLINQSVTAPDTPQRLEKMAIGPSPETSTRPMQLARRHCRLKRLICYADGNVDNFILMLQGQLAQRHRFIRQKLHILDMTAHPGYDLLPCITQQ